MPTHESTGRSFSKVIGAYRQVRPAIRPEITTLDATTGERSTTEVKRTYVMPFKRFRLSDVGTQYHEFFEFGFPTASVFMESSQLARVNDLNPYLPTYDANATFTDHKSSYEKDPSSGNEKSFSQTWGTKYEYDGFREFDNAIFGYRPGLTSTKIGPNYRKKVLSSWKNAHEGYVQSQNGHGLPLEFFCGELEDSFEDEDVCAHANSVAYMRDDNGVYYVSHNTGVYPFEYRVDECRQFMTKYHAPKAPCAGITNEDPPQEHFRHEMYFAIPPEVGSVKSFLYSHSASHNVIGRYGYPGGLIVHGNIARTAEPKDRDVYSEKSEISDAFILERYVNGVKVGIRWLKPKGDDEYPQHAEPPIIAGSYPTEYDTGGTLRSINHGRDRNGKYTARAVCYEEAPGRIVFGHWVNRLGVKRKAVYLAATNSVVAEDLEDSWLMRVMDGRRMDGGIISKATKDGQDLTFLVPTIDGMGGHDTDPHQVRVNPESHKEMLSCEYQRNWGVNHGASVDTSEARRLPYLAGWLGGDVRQPPTFRVFMGREFMADLDYCRKIDDTGFLVVGGYVRGHELTSIPFYDVGRLDSGMFDSQHAFPSTVWDLPRKGPQGLRSAFVLDVRHMFSSERGREIRVPALGRMFPILFRAQDYACTDAVPEGPNYSTVSDIYMTVKLDITKPGLYSVGVDSEFFGMDGSRCRFWMRLYKGSAMVLPVQGFDPPAKPDGTMDWCWVRGGRFRVKAGEEGEYRLLIAPDISRFGSPQNVNKFNAGAYSPHVSMKRWDPAAPHRWRGSVSNVEIENYHRHGDLIVPLVFGEAQ